MGGFGVSLEVEPRPGADPGDVRDMAEQISEAVWDLIGAYTNSDLCKPIYEYIDEALAEDHIAVERRGAATEILYDFPDHASCSAELACHWFQLGLACSQDRLDEVSSDAGWVVKGERESVKALLDETRLRFLEARGKLWSVYGDLESYRISGDDGPLEPTDDERERAEQLIRDSSSDDPMTRMLQPHPEFIEGILASLDTDSPQVIGSVLWYLSNVGSPDEASIEAIFSAAATDQFEVHQAARRAVARLARHADLAGPVRGRLGHDDPRVHAAALGAVPPLCDRGLLEVTEAVDALLDGLTHPSPAVDVAAENLGFVKLEGYRNRVIRELLELLGGDPAEEAAHGALLTLVNIHLKNRDPSDEVIAAFRAQADSGFEHAGLATWALSMFGAT